MKDNNLYPVAEYVKQDITPLNILVFIIDKCNFKCSYCYNRMPRHNTVADLSLIYDFIIDIKKKTNRYLNISLIGGEPTLHPDLVDFCKKAVCLKDVKVEVLTNFSNTLEYYMKLLELGVKIAASWHGSASDKRNLQYVKNMMKIPRKYFDNDLIEVRIMFEQDNWENSDQAFKLLYPKYKEFVEISLLVLNNGKPYKYTKEQLDKYHDYIVKLKYTRDFFTIRYNDGTEEQVSFNDMYLNPLVNFYLWKCNAGLDYIYIHCDGNVYNCQSYYEHYKNPICNINETKGEYKKELFKPCICCVDYCSCDFDVRKEKILKNVKY